MPRCTEHMRRHYNLTLNPDIVEKTKARLGLVPFSRYVEALLSRELTLAEKRKAEQAARTEPQAPAAPAAPPKAAPPAQKAQEPKRWYEGMPFKKGGKP